MEKARQPLPAIPPEKKRNDEKKVNFVNKYLSHYCSPSHLRRSGGTAEKQKASIPEETWPRLKTRCVVFLMVGLEEEERSRGKGWRWKEERKCFKKKTERKKDKHCRDARERKERGGRRRCGFKVGKKSTQNRYCKSYKLCTTTTPLSSFSLPSLMHGKELDSLAVPLSPGTRRPLG